MDLQNIFIHGNTYEEKNGIIHLNLSDTNQNGGNLNDNIIHLSLSSTTNNIYQNGGATDSSEYFNKLAEKIVNSKITSQNGGFNVITNVDESSEIFLSSETINEINNTNMSGGAKKKLNFNFNDLKKHLLKVTEELEFSGGSDNEDDIFDNDDDEDDDSEEEAEIRELFNDTDSESDDDLDKITKKNKISMEAHRSKQKNAKRQTEDETDDESDSDLDIDLDTEDEDEILDKKEQNELKKNINKIATTDSASLGGSSTEYEFSDSISSPKLISYRKIENRNDSNKTMVGRRFM